MHRLQLAELRDSWPTWLGVSLGFITTNFALVLSALTLVAGSLVAVQAFRTVGGGFGGQVAAGLNFIGIDVGLLDLDCTDSGP